MGEFSLPILFYGIILATIMALGALFYKPRKQAIESGSKSHMCDPV